MSFSRALASFPLLLAAGLVVGVAACDPVLSERRVQDIEVGPQLLPCYGVGPQLCMQVRPAFGGAWEYFAGEIEGFVFEAGFNYVLRVERTVLRNTSAGPVYRFRLIDILSKTPVPPEGTSAHPVS